jgi:hypothetical protein
MNRVRRRILEEELGHDWEVNSGSCSFMLEDKVDITFRDGYIYTDVPPADYSWSLEGGPEDVVKWRYHKTESEKITDSLAEGKPVKFNNNLDFHGDFSNLSKEEQDQVINPKHYKILPKEAMQLFLPKGMEYMDIMRYALKEHVGVKAHVLGQVFKYSFRLGGKDDELQDARKIAWYAARLVEEIEFERGLTQNFPRGDF